MMQMLWRQLAPFSFPGNTEGKIEWHNQDGNPQQLFPVGGDDVWGTKENFYTTDPSSLSWNTFQQLLTIQQICLPVIHKDSLWAGYFGGKKKNVLPKMIFQTCLSASFYYGQSGGSEDEWNRGFVMYFKFT